MRHPAIISAKRVSILDMYLHNRRRRDGSIMTLNDERLFDFIDISYKLLDVFFEDKKLYDYYKIEVLDYIFRSLNGKYYKIEDEFKEEYFKRVQEAFKVFIKKYGLYKDIKNNVNENILEFFKFEDIVAEVIAN